MTLAAAATDPVNWLLSRPQLIFLFFAGAVWLIKLINRARAEASEPEPEPQAAGRLEAGGPDLDDEARTRRVREDILRKIAERRAGAAPPQRAPVRDARPAPTAPATSGAASAGSRGSPVGPPAAVSSAIKAQAAGSLGGPPFALPASPLSGAVPGPTAGSLWLDELRTRDSARKAILVREILGPPVAFR
jgi:hypothetical protein